jgi:hypothetical protein
MNPSAPNRPSGVGHRTDGPDPIAPLSELLANGEPAPARGAPSWSFLTNHARVLVCLAADPAATLRAVAARVGLTERAVQRIVAELATEGYIAVSRVGRRNRYAVRRSRPLRPRLHAHCTAGDLIDLATTNVL